MSLKVTKTIFKIRPVGEANLEEAEKLTAKASQTATCASSTGVEEQQQKSRGILTRNFSEYRRPSSSSSAAADENESAV